jgi:hypothetical protein
MIPSVKTGGDLMNDRKERDSYWPTLIQKNTEIGMSAAAFCKDQGINAQRFYFSRRRFLVESAGTKFIRLAVLIWSF